MTSQIAHKSEIDAVIVGVTSGQQVDEQVPRLLKISGTVLVEQMIDDAVAELLIGVSYDSQFGHYLILGFGGTMVELIGDRVILLFPVCREDIVRGLENLKTWPLLNGFRGRKLADVESIINTVLSIVQMVERKHNEIVEIEINPLMVKAESEGVVIADALIRKIN